MSNRFMFVLGIYVFAQIFSLMLEGRTGIAGTVLASAMTEASTTAIVEPTRDFLDANILIIQDETLAYTGVTKNADGEIVSFTGLARGINQTSAATHGVGQTVFDEAPGLLNRMVAMQEHDVECTGNAVSCWVSGKFRVVGTGLSWVTAVPQMVKFDYKYLDGNLIYLKYMLWILGAGLVLDFGRMIWGR